MCVSAPSSPSTWPAVQVRRYSCHRYVKNDISGIRREYVGMNKSSNYNCSILPQQEPLVARVHLLDVKGRLGEASDRKVSKLKGCWLKISITAVRKLLRHRSLPAKTPGEFAGRQVGQMCSVNHAKSIPNPIKAGEKAGEAEIKNPKSMNYDVMKDDAIINGDVIDRANPINKLIARKRKTRGKQSLLPIGRFLPGVNEICSKTIIKLALILVIVTNVIRGGIGINSVERLCIVGLSNTRWQDCERNFRYYNFLFLPRLLRNMTTAITSFWLELGNNIPTIGFHKRKSRISRDKSGFRNSIGINGKSFRPVIGCFSCYATREPRATLWDVFGGKTFVAYIFLLAAFCASCLGYFISYTRNTDFGYRFHALLNFIYIYLCMLFGVRGHPVNGHHT